MARPLQAQWLQDLTRREISPDVTATVIAVAAVMASYASKDGRQVRPGHARVAAETRTSERTVKRAVAVLVALGWLTLERPGKHGSATPANLYRLTWPSDRGDMGDPSPLDSWDDRGDTGDPSPPVIGGHAWGDDQGPEGPLVADRGATGDRPRGHGWPTTSPVTNPVTTSCPLDTTAPLRDDGRVGDDEQHRALSAPFGQVPGTSSSDEDQPVVSPEIARRGAALAREALNRRKQP